MKNRIQWLEADGPLPEGLGKLLQSAEPTREMTEAELARSLAQVKQLVAMPKGPSNTWMVVKKIISTLVGIAGSGLVVGGGSLVTPNQPGASAATPQPMVVETKPVLPIKQVQQTIETAQATDPAPLPPRAKPTSRASMPKPSTSVKAASPDSLQDEIALLNEARAALSSNPREALDWLEEHARAFPQGHLGTEREYLMISALKRLGRTAQARARAEALLKQSLGSPYEKKVRRKLEELQ